MTNGMELPGGKTTLGGSGAIGKSINKNGTGSEVTTETEILTEKVPGIHKQMSASSTNVATGDSTDVRGSSRSDLAANSAVAISESTASASGWVLYELLIDGIKV